jgi:hypothetical protein
MSKNEILTIEELFREEREGITELVQKKLVQLAELDLDDERYFKLKSEIFKLEMVILYLEERIKGKYGPTSN